VADLEAAELATLVLRAQQRDAAAFTVLYREFARVVHGIVLARCGPGRAEDLTQDVFVTAFQRLPELRDAAAFPAWLCTSARNHATDTLRRGRRAVATEPLPDGELPGSGREPGELIATRDAAARVLACVRELPQAYRETLVLRLVEGLTGPEIASRTGLTHGSVRVNLTRGMTLLRPLLQEAGLP
jgi:RNA polymerase sigma-70 factor (ECF subfamily)